MHYEYWFINCIFNMYIPGLIAFGYEDVEVETTTRFVFQKKEKAILDSKTINER